VAAGTGRRQRAEGADLYRAGNDRRTGKGAQRPNGQADDLAERLSERPGVLIPPRAALTGSAGAGE
jgi:hypothetical protein